MDKNSTAQVDKMSPEEAKVFLRDLLDGEAMRSPEVNQHVRKMLRGQRDQVAWFDRMEPGADAECLPALVDAKPKKPIGAIVKVKCSATNPIMKWEAARKGSTRNTRKEPFNSASPRCQKQHRSRLYTRE